MNELIAKISSYNLFNYLLPGVIFSFLVQKFTNYSLIQDDILIGLFLYYFAGLVISRVGSLIIKPFLEWIKFLKFAEYKDYVAACKHDPKLDLFSEGNNMFRTLISMIFLFLILKLYELLSFTYSVLGCWDIYILLIFILILFLFSYKKQTDYVNKRISLNK